MAVAPDSNRLQTINTSRVLRAVRLNPRVSRIKVAEMLALDRSTVTKIVRNLLEKGIVLTAGKNTVQTGVGRKQIGLVINDGFGAIVGIEIQSGKYSVVVTSLSGEILASFSEANANDVDSESLPSYVLSVVQKAKDAVRRKKLRLLGIGIALPGVVDPYKGVVVRSTPLSVFDPFDLRTALAEKCGDFMFFENDANCCCWGELAFNPEGRSRDFISVLGEFNRGGPPGRERSGGFAVGLGFSVGECVHHGAHFTAGEFRSFQVKPPPQSAQFSVPSNHLAALPDDEKALDVVYRELCENLAFLVNCFDFTKIVFAGDIPAHQGNLRNLLSDAVAENSLYDLPKDIQLDFSPAREFSVAWGAAGLFAEKLFSIPDVTGFRDELVGYSLFERVIG